MQRCICYNYIEVKKMSKTNAEIKNAYAKKAYDDIRLQVKKGQKEKIRAYAQSIGMSLQGYINKLIADDMGAALTVPSKQQGD